MPGYIQITGGAEELVGRIGSALVSLVDILLETDISRGQISHVSTANDRELVG